MDKGDAEPEEVEENGLEGYEALVRDDENIVVEPIRDRFSGLIRDVQASCVGVDIVPEEPLLLELAVKDSYFFREGTLAWGLSGAASSC